jgi:cell division initiation protein
MELTQIDVLHTQFKRGVRGYSCAQVDSFLREVAASIETYSTERAQLRDKVESLTSEVDRCRQIESTMNSALVLAQKTADELKANAHREAEVILREAEQAGGRRAAEANEELVELQSQIRTLREERDRLESEFRAFVRSCSEWLDRQSASRAVAAEGQS